MPFTKMQIMGTVFFIMVVGFNLLPFPKQVTKTSHSFLTRLRPSQIITPVSRSSKLSFNELGQIMIVEYHLIGVPESVWRRTPANFYNDLEMFYEEGYYPIPLQDLVSGLLNIPAGKTPFVITFDDSSPGQFRYLKKGNNLVIDPASALGIMEEFKQQHPDFPLTATFFVVPSGAGLFGQTEFIRQKLEFLQKNGYEIGNHTFSHVNLAKTDDEGVQKQIALAVQSIHSYLPDYPVHSFALPYGIYAKNRLLEHDGQYHGIKYHNDTILLVGSGPVPSPYSSKFNPYRLERIQARDTPWGPKSFISKFQKHPALRFVSDGDPAVISIPENLIDKLSERAISTYHLNLLERL